MKTLPPIRLIIGLGNPETRYANTYHSVGLMAVAYFESLEPTLGIPLVASTASMNISGAFVAQTLRTKDASAETLLIVHDDSDLPLGTYRLGFGRGTAGHHGVESIVATLRTKSFWRLRIGIRPKAQAGLPAKALPRAKAGSFVLKQISKKDERVFAGVFEAAAKEIRTLVLATDKTQRKIN